MNRLERMGTMEDFDEDLNDLYVYRADENVIVNEITCVGIELKDPPVYVLDVAAEDLSKWRVWRTYRQLKAAHQRISPLTRQAFKTSKEFKPLKGLFPKKAPAKKDKVCTTHGNFLRLEESQGVYQPQSDVEHNLRGINIKNASANDMAAMNKVMEEAMKIERAHVDEESGRVEKMMSEAALKLEEAALLKMEAQKERDLAAQERLRLTQLCQDVHSRKAELDQVFAGVLSQRRKNIGHQIAGLEAQIRRLTEEESLCCNQSFTRDPRYSPNSETLPVTGIITSSSMEDLRTATPPPQPKSSASPPSAQSVPSKVPIAPPRAAPIPPKSFPQSGPATTSSRPLLSQNNIAPPSKSGAPGKAAPTPPIGSPKSTAPLPPSRRESTAPKARAPATPPQSSQPEKPCPPPTVPAPLPPSPAPTTAPSATPTPTFVQEETPSQEIASLTSAEEPNRETIPEMETSPNLDISVQDTQTTPPPEQDLLATNPVIATQPTSPTSALSGVEASPITPTAAAPVPNTDLLSPTPPQTQDAAEPLLSLDDPVTPVKESTHYYLSETPSSSRKDSHDPFALAEPAEFSPWMLDSPAGL